MGWMDDLAAGQGRKEEIEGGLEGDLGKWAQGYTVRRSAEQRDAQWAEQPVRSGVRVLPILVFAVLVMFALIIFIH